jgi:hypothetical protein
MRRSARAKSRAIARPKQSLAVIRDKRRLAFKDEISSSCLLCRWSSADSPHAETIGIVTQQPYPQRY